MSARDILLVSVGQTNTRPHWAIWIPNSGNELLGKKIHVIGSPMTGFTLEFQHNFSWEQEPAFIAGKVHFFHLGCIEHTEVVDYPASETSGIIRTNNPSRGDALESLAFTLPPPSATASEHLPKGLPSQVAKAYMQELPHVRRCQEWTTELIAEAVKAGILPSSANTVVDEAKALNPKPAPDS